MVEGHRTLETAENLFQQMSQRDPPSLSSERGRAGLCRCPGSQHVIRSCTGARDIAGFNTRLVKSLLHYFELQFGLPCACSPEA